MLKNSENNGTEKIGLVTSTPEPTPTFCHLDPEEQISVKFNLK